MPKGPRPTEPRALKAWVGQNWPGDPVRQKREYDAGIQAASAAKASAEKHKAEMARRQQNAAKTRRGY